MVEIPLLALFFLLLAEALEALRQAAEARRLAYVPLDLDYAFHSAAMDPVRDALLADLAGLSQASPALPMLSTVTGEGLAAGEADATYWWRNLREPVRFEAAQRAALSRKASRLAAGSVRRSSMPRS
jgi:acyl transferase domain-containing protein